jgi:molecular chaperone DnaJ
MPKDYYSALGVGRSASQDEIKAAYKRLAKQYHPDLNKDNKTAEAKFKEINEAYRVLGDEQKRKVYDTHGADEQAQSQPGGGAYSGFGGEDMGGFNVDLGDIFGEFFGGGGRRRAKGEDIETVVRITLEEAAAGKRVTIDMDKRAPCSKCKGTGAEGGRRVPCATCKGAGQVRRVQRTPFGAMQVAQVCPDCRGSGSRAEKACRACEGEGFEEREESVTVELPAGIQDRMTLRVAGAGNAGRAGQPPGDLLVGVLVEEHELFTREGDDLHVQSTITYPQAVLGTTIDVPTIAGGTVTLKIPEGTEHGTVLRARGKGMPGLRGGHGDLLVTVKLHVPRSVSGKERELLEKLAGIEKPKGFFERFKL